MVHPFVNGRDVNRESDADMSDAEGRMDVECRRCAAWGRDAEPQLDGAI